LCVLTTPRRTQFSSLETKMRKKIGKKRPYERTRAQSDSDSQAKPKPQTQTPKQNISQTTDIGA
jgi:hypothetical protein